MREYGLTRQYLLERVALSLSPCLRILCDLAKSCKAHISQVAANHIPHVQGTGRHQFEKTF